jgi:hypothetical protein
MPGAITPNGSLKWFFHTEQMKVEGKENSGANQFFQVTIQHPSVPDNRKRFLEKLARDVDEALSNPNVKSTTVYWPIEDRSSGFDTPIDEPPHYDPKVPDHWHVYIDWSKTKSDLPDAVREGWLTRTGTTI